MLHNGLPPAINDAKMNVNICFIFFLVDRLIDPLLCFFSIKGHAALDRNSGPGNNTLLLLLT